VWVNSKQRSMMAGGARLWSGRFARSGVAYMTKIVLAGDKLRGTDYGIKMSRREE